MTHHGVTELGTLSRPMAHQGVTTVSISPMAHHWVVGLSPLSRPLTGWQVQDPSPVEAQAILLWPGMRGCVFLHLSTSCFLRDSKIWA